MAEQKPEKTMRERPAEQPEHVGGINAVAGGVDPAADENLLRLSGGP